MEIEPVGDVRAAIGESPFWDAEHQRLYWVDINAGRLYCTDPATGTSDIFQMPEMIGCCVPRRDGGLAVALETGLYLYEPHGEALLQVAELERDKQDNRFNDGVCDRAGRFWAGSMHREQAAPTGSVYRLDPDRRVSRFVGGFWVPNGMAFSPDGRTMYLSDSNPRVRTIWAYDYDPDEGTPHDQRVFVDTHGMPGRPDGGQIDADGCYWMAGVGGWQIVRFTPAGKVERVIDMPVEKPSKVAFGGPNRDVLYVTTLGTGLTPGTEDRQPLAGALLAIHGVGVQGLPEPEYHGA